MNACSAVERENDKVLKKYQSIRDHTDQALDELIDHVSSIRNELAQAPEDMECTPLHNLMINQCAKKVKDVASRLSTEHKELHGGISKIGKAIDKNFIIDNTACAQDGVFDNGNAPLLNQVICEHFYRQGRLDIGDSLVKEACLDIDPSHKEPFTELNRILESCKNHDLDAALDWAKSRHTDLQERGSSLEFKLHRLKYLDLLKTGDIGSALLYSRNFSKFAKVHEKEVQQLMGCLMYCKTGLEDSPYASLLDPVHWIEICDEFTRDACALQGLSLESPLEVCVTGGCVALPSLLQIRQVMLQRQCTGVWTSKDELPIEIDLGSQYRYHSIFACPILRQQCSDSNPPMRLSCGHVISRDALHKLTNGNKVKCPYCPLEMSPDEARQVFFY